MGFSKDSKFKARKSPGITMRRALSPYREVVTGYHEFHADFDHERNELLTTIDRSISVECENVELRLELAKERKAREAVEAQLEAIIKDQNALTDALKRQEQVIRQAIQSIMNQLIETEP